jgi:hypothetical protein
MKKFVRITCLADRVLVADQWLYAGDSRVVHRRYADAAMAALPGAARIDEIGDGAVTEAQPVALEETHAHHAPIADRQPDRGAARKGRRP